MKRISIVFAIALMFSMAAFAPYAPSSSKPNEQLLRPRHTPTPTPTTAPAPTSTTAPAGLTAPTLLTPANNVTLHPGNVTWSWTAVPGAVRYHIQAGNGTAFDQQYNIIEYWDLTTTSWSFDVSSGFIFYFPHLYWRVQAIDANNNYGPWSQVWVTNFVSP